MSERVVALQRLLPLVLLVPCLLWGACAELPSNPSGGQMTPQIAVGQKIADLPFLDTRGNQVSLHPLLQKAEKTALIFYRGYWCSYCQGQFADLRLKLSEVEGKDTQIIGVSVDEPDLVDEFGHNIERRYLKEVKKASAEEASEAIDPPFLLLSDSSREAVRKLGIGEEHERFGLVARPTTLLLDKAGTIRWLYIGKSADDRPTPDVVLKALKWWF